MAFKYKREKGIMKRKTLKLKQGFAFVDENGWGRYIGKNGDAFDLDPKKHHELIKMVLAKGKGDIEIQTKQKPKFEQLTLL